MSLQLMLVFSHLLPEAQQRVTFNTWYLNIAIYRITLILNGVPSRFQLHVQFIDICIFNKCIAAAAIVQALPTSVDIQQLLRN